MDSRNELVSPLSLLNYEDLQKSIRVSKATELLRALDAEMRESGDDSDSAAVSGCHEVRGEHRRLANWRLIMQDWCHFEHRHPGQIRALVRQQGIPDVLRGQMWLALGKASGLRAEHPGLFARLLSNTTVQQEDAIARDITRTFPKHQFFRDSCAVGQRELFHVLRAYAAHDTEVGYCQGMGFVVAVMLQHMCEEDAFFLLVALTSHPEYNMRELYRPGMPKFQPAMREFTLLLERCLPALADHFATQGIEPGMYASQWIMTLFAYSCPHELVVRVWDIFLVEGWGIIFRVSVALLASAQKRLLGLQFEDILNELKDLAKLCDPDEILPKALALNIPESDLTAIFAPDLSLGDASSQGEHDLSTAGRSGPALTQNIQVVAIGASSKGDVDLD